MKTKKCYRCGKRRKLDDYYPHAGMASGRLNLCRFCKVREAAVWRRANRQRFNDTRRARELRLRGIDAQTYDRLAQEQGGRCAGCGRTDSGQPGTRSNRPLCVDHDHETGRVRGLLCHRCNLIMTRTHGNAEVLRALLRYLRRAS